MKKGLVIFLFLALLLILARIAYVKYCESKENGCTKTTYEDNYLTEDHVDY